MQFDDWTAEENAENDARAKFDPLDPNAPAVLPAREELLPLTAKQYAFCAAFCKTGSVSGAAAAAGVSRSAANEYLTNRAVLAEIDRRQKLTAIYNARDAADVMGDIYQTYREARAAGDLKTALKALELEAKHRGALVEKLEVSTSIDLAAEITAARRRLLPSNNREGAESGEENHNI